MARNGAVVFAPDARRARWISSELCRAGIPEYACAEFVDVMARLGDVTMVRPQILVADFDALGGGDLFALQSLREHGWFGSIIGLGRVPPALAESLAVDRILRPPLYEDLLCDAVESLGIHDVTVPIPIMGA